MFGILKTTVPKYVVIKNCDVYVCNDVIERVVTNEINFILRNVCTSIIRKNNEPEINIIFSKLSVYI